MSTNETTSTAGTTAENRTAHGAHGAKGVRGGRGARGVRIVRTARTARTVAATSAGLLVTLAAVAGCTDTTTGPSGAASGAAASAPPSSTTADASGSGNGMGTPRGEAPRTADLPRETLGTPPAQRLADGLVPPTNRWFSGLVFPEQAQPVFPSPLSYTPTTRGFAVGVPQVVTSAATIMGSATSDVAVDAGADSFLVSGYDDASVEVTLRRSGADLLRVALAEGAPTVAMTASADVPVTLTAASWTRLGDAQWVGTDQAGRSWALTPPDGASVKATGGKLSVSLAKGSDLDLVAAPDGVEIAAGDALAKARPATSARSTWSVDASAATTTLDYRTREDAPTILTAAPHQHGCGTPIGTYPSVAGTVQACVGTRLEWSAPLVQPAGSLDLSGLDDDQRTELTDQVRADAASLPDLPADTYFGGKALQRDASLLQIARQLGLDDVTETLTSRLTDALETWTQADGCRTRDERCFAYDPGQHLVIGKAIAFGSEQANDTHFHLGYFLGAAAMVAGGEGGSGGASSGEGGSGGASSGEGDAGLAGRIAPVIDALAQNLAAEDTTDFSPRMRTFDAYWSHSWASGWAPFADGNNQESVSEAINAWNGLALWADVRGDAALGARARWMLSMEVQASKAYWTDFDTADPVYQGFDHTVTSLVWGGKRDWATWFSPEPSAMLGILVLPASPVSTYLAGDPARIRANLSGALGKDGSFDVMFGDQLLMYSSLAGEQDARAALDKARSLPSERIDDGDTRSYLLAFIMARLSQE